MNQVYALLGNDGLPISIYANLSNAEAKRDEYNADPYIAPDELDPDAPYTVETWSVK